MIVFPNSILKDVFQQFSYLLKELDAVVARRKKKFMDIKVMVRSQFRALPKALCREYTFICISDSMDTDKRCIAHPLNMLLIGPMSLR